MVTVGDESRAKPFSVEDEDDGGDAVDEDDADRPDEDEAELRPSVNWPQRADAVIGILRSVHG